MADSSVATNYSQDNLIVINAFGTVNGNSAKEKEFLETIWRGDYENTKHLIAENEEQSLNIINCKDDEGRYAIMKAAFQGFADIVRLLIENGADLTKLSKSGESVLMFAAAGGDAATVKILLDYGADVDWVNKNGWTSLMIASYRGHLNAVEELYYRNAYIHDVHKFGWTPLMLAAATGQSSILKFLVERGAFMQLTNYSGDTALIVAAKRGFIDSVNTLIESGYDLKSAKRELKALIIKLSSERIKEALTDYIKSLDGKMKAKEETSPFQVRHHPDSEWVTCLLEKDKFFHNLSTRESRWENPEDWRNLKLVDVKDNQDKSIPLPAGRSPSQMAELFISVQTIGDDESFQILRAESDSNNMYARSFAMLLHVVGGESLKDFVKDLNNAINLHGQLLPWLMKKVAKDDDPWSQYILGCCYLYKIAPAPYEDRVGLLFMLSANQGIAPSMYQFAKFLQDVKEIDDWTHKTEKIFLCGGASYQVLSLIKTSADLGYPYAQVDLAEYYDDQEDKESQQKYLEMAAVQQFLPGIYALCQYFKLQNKNDERIKYLQIAASKDMQEAQFDLGFVYEKGLPSQSGEIMIAIDLVEAERWYTLSASNGSDRAKERIQILQLEKTSPDCSICFEKMNPRGGKFLLTPGCCGVQFHFDCIKTATASKKRCPVCRKVIGLIGS